MRYESSKAIEPMSQTVSLPETPQTYWRWGLPSLILAITTVVLVATSQGVIEPSIDSRYDSVVQRALSGGRLEDLKTAELASQRLMVRYPDEPKYRRIHAEVNLKISSIASRLLSEEIRKDSPGYEQWSHLMNATRSRARESIRSASRLKGTDGQWAKRWLLGEEIRWIRQSCRDDSGQIQGLLERYLQNSNQPDAAESAIAMGTLEIQLANRLSPPLSHDIKDQLLGSGVQRIAMNLERSRASQEEPSGLLSAEAWLAEGLASIEPEKAIQIARDVILKHSSRLQNVSNLSVAQRIDEFEGFFRCLMILSGPEEATSSVLSRLEQIPSPDQMLLRHLAVASQLRAWASAKSYPKGAYASMPPGAILKSAVRLGSDHPDLSWLLESLLLDQEEMETQLAEGSDRSLKSSEDPFMDQLDWIRRVIERKSDEAIRGMDRSPEWSEKDMDVALSMMSLMIQISRKRHLEWTQLEPVVESMIQAYPSRAEFKLGRAILLCENRRWGQAIADLEMLAKIDPANKLIDQLLRKAQEQSLTDQEGDPKTEHVQR